MSTVHINKTSFEAKLPIQIDMQEPLNQIKIDRRLARELKTQMALHSNDPVHYPNPVPPEGYLIEVEVLNLNKAGGSFHCNMTNSEKIPTFSGQISKQHHLMIERDGKHYFKINLAEITLSNDDPTQNANFDTSINIPTERKRKEEDEDARRIEDEIDLKSLANSTS